MTLSKKFSKAFYKKLFTGIFVVLACIATEAATSQYRKSYFFYSILVTFITLGITEIARAFILFRK